MGDKGSLSGEGTDDTANSHPSPGEPVSLNGSRMRGDRDSPVKMASNQRV